MNRNQQGCRVSHNKGNYDSDQHTKLLVRYGYYPQTWRIFWLDKEKRIYFYLMPDGKNKNSLLEQYI